MATKNYESTTNAFEIEVPSIKLCMPSPNKTTFLYLAKTTTAVEGEVGV